MEQHRTERSLGELFSDLTRDLGTLVRQEINLARAEMGQKVSNVGKDIGFLAVGGLIGYAGFLALIATVIIVLGTIGLPWWLAALIVGIVVAGIGYFLVRKGLDALKRQNLAPEQTVDTIKEDVKWMKEQAS